MGQLWGQRKNCAVAQPGASRGVAAAAGLAGFGISRGLGLAAVSQFGSSVRLAGFR